MQGDCSNDKNKSTGEAYQKSFFEKVIEIHKEIIFHTYIEVPWEFSYEFCLIFSEQQSFNGRFWMVNIATGINQTKIFLKQLFVNKELSVV